MQLLALMSPVAVGGACGSLAAALFGPLLARRARSRLRRAGWLAATALCRRVLPCWAALAATLGLVAANDAPAWWLTAIVGVSTLGAQLLLGAGRIEARGRVATGRALGRIGGRLLFVGASAGAGIAATEGLAASIPLALASVAGLLSGLAGKPRPSGTVAALLYGIAVVVFAAS